MKSEKGLYLIASVLSSFLAAGYTAVIVVDFYYGYTPGYLTALHILTAIVLYAAAIVNWRRYKKH